MANLPQLFQRHREIDGAANQDFPTQRTCQTDFLIFFIRMWLTRPQGFIKKRSASHGTASQGGQH